MRFLLVIFVSLTLLIHTCPMITLGQYDIDFGDVFPQLKQNNIFHSPKRTTKASQPDNMNQDDLDLKMENVNHFKRGNNNLHFHVHNFNGTFKSFSWNAEDTDEIMAQVDSRVYLSENRGQNFTDLSSRLEDFHVSYPSIWGENSAGYGVRSMIRGINDNNIVILLGHSNHFWISRDGTNTFQKVVTSYVSDDEIVPLFFQSLYFNPRFENHLMGIHVDSRCFDNPRTDPKPCSNNLFLSTNYGSTWELLSTHVHTAYWGMKGNIDDFNEVVYYLSSHDKSVDQFISDSHGIIESKPSQKRLSVFDIAKKISNDLHFFVDQLVVSGLYVYIQSEKPSLIREEERNFYYVEVSYGGREFKKTHFDGYELRKYTFLDFSESSVLVIDSPANASQTNEDFIGDSWFSDHTGAYFVRSLKKVIMVSDGEKRNVDFHKIQSLEGTFVANSLDDFGLVRTKISWNQGGTWYNVQSQEVLDGLIDERSFPFVLFGELHSKISGSHNGFHSQKSAPGSVIAVGKHGVKFEDYISGNIEDGDVYYSRNGGRVFRKILNGRHYCQLMDEGNIIVCVSGASEGTQKLLYTLDSGISWVEETFIDSPVQVSWVYSDPNSFGLSCVIEASQNGSLYLISFNLEQLNLPECNDEDYEFWYPSDSNNGRLCILGHHVTYVRPSATSICISKLDDFVVKQVDCPCSDEDFSCDYGYFYNNTGKFCSPEEDTEVDQINCEDDVYMKDLHFKKTPGNTCSTTLPGAIDLEALVPTECPVTDLIDTKDQAQILAISLGIGFTVTFILIIGAIIFVVWSKRRGYLHYRKFNTDTGIALQ